MKASFSSTVPLGSELSPSVLCQKAHKCSNYHSIVPLRPYMGHIQPHNKYYKLCFPCYKNLHFTKQHGNISHKLFLFLTSESNNLINLREKVYVDYVLQPEINYIFRNIQINLTCNCNSKIYKLCFQKENRVGSLFRRWHSYFLTSKLTAENVSLSFSLLFSLQESLLK